MAAASQPQCVSLLDWCQGNTDNDSVHLSKGL